ncbi:hypothetical protein J6590_032625 [Homalodisca vitripennis]|nr:hypothetical protein J6590_032625 [Homalodisca vitripennis]
MGGISKILLLSCLLCIQEAWGEEEEVDLKTQWSSLDLQDYYSPCGSPRPKAVPIQELFSVTQRDPETQFQPYMLMLPRCDNAGCCGQGYHCVSINTTEDSVMVLTKKNSRTDMRRIHFVLHLECTCRPEGESLLNYKPKQTTP